MNENARRITIGTVLRSDIHGFVAASRIPEPEVPTFGTFVSAPIQHEQAELIGLVYNISLQDDPFLRSIAANINMADPSHQEFVRDQRENRVIPVEIAVASVAYRYHNDPIYHYGYPPQPPIVLYEIRVCTPTEVLGITHSPDFMRVLLDNRDIPFDELVPTVLLRAAKARPAAEREQFLLGTGKMLARHLGRDSQRLDKILRHLMTAL